jgi:enamine deaminase RidA (YjgF/YER057c/UK114 family)
MTTLLNPANVHTPIGAYSHTAIVPAGTSLIFVSGQVGVLPDGSIPASFAEQVEMVFQNLRACLAAHGAGMESVVKLTTYVVSGQDIQVMRQIRLRHFGEHKPTSTAVFVPQLVNPALLLEVEAIAAKRA